MGKSLCDLWRAKKREAIDKNETEMTYDNRLVKITGLVWPQILDELS